MPHKTYSTLPLESLYELLASSIRDLLIASDQKNGQTAFKAVKKQIEILLDLIDDKRKVKKN